jgi:excisionase family DNA binding protein
MNQDIDNSSILSKAFAEAFRQVLREAKRPEPSETKQVDERLLTVREAAEVLNVSLDWLYRNSKKLPFSKKLGPKMLRFSYQGLQKYLATIRPLSRN